MARVKTNNTAAYLVDVMTDTSSSSIGDGEPEFLLQSGAEVQTVGAAVKNKHGTLYSPVTVKGRDDMYWVRNSSLDESAISSMIGPMSRSAPETPWMKYLLYAVGATMIGIGAWKLTGRSSASSRRTVRMKALPWGGR